MSSTFRIVVHYALARGLRTWKTREQLERWQERRIIRHVHQIRALIPILPEVVGWRGRIRLEKLSVD
ncbi:hypothetical protein Q0F98_27370 [Paenibacillus amylolyticus]|nr:hypothetical protein Q0F98_27370 [Paenibacillus amylolyticus]